MNHAKFLQKTEQAVLLYLGGAHVTTATRRLRVDDPRPGVGAYRFAIEGRRARALEPASPDLEGLPRLRGLHVDGFVVHERSLRRLRVLGDDALPPLALVWARRWHSGDIVFDLLAFDTDVEEMARGRLERRLPLVGKGVSPQLRVAYGIALARAVAARRQVPLSVREAAPFATAIADGGEAVALATVTTLAHRRAEAERRARVIAIAHGRRPAPERQARPLDNPVLRAEAALEAAGARMLSARPNGRCLEVAFEIDDERIVATVDPSTLHVYDAGICLAGADELLTLESLPAVIHEAIRTDRLVITRS